MSTTTTETGALWQLGATELASAIRAGDVSSREVIETHLRLEQVNPAVNALRVPSAGMMRPGLRASRCMFQNSTFAPTAPTLCEPRQRVRPQRPPCSGVDRWFTRLAVSRKQPKLTLTDPLTGVRLTRKRQKKGGVPAGGRARRGCQPGERASTPQ